MSVVIDQNDLPEEVGRSQAVELAYPDQLSAMTEDLKRQLPVLVECDKDLAPFVYAQVRNRLRAEDVKCTYLDGRPRAEDRGADGMPLGFVGTLLRQLREAVRGAIEQRVLVLPHLDLLTTSQGGLTSEAREMVPLLYENPEVVFLGFKDPSFPLLPVINNLFPRHYTMLGIPRDRLGHLVTQREARKFGEKLHAWSLYKHVSGMNAIRLRKVLGTLDGEDYPPNADHVYRQIRQATAPGQLEIPQVDLDNDLGGYKKVKKRLRAEILDVLVQKDQLTDERAINQLEELIPRGMIFWGPPGTGKTLFAKAMASAIGAAITVVSGPELKSRWVGESEENLRLIFHRARQSAPSIIVFDELDSFASARGTYTGSGVEHSMVNQLLTEMDGFRKGELVFVIGTTNFVEILDPALLRPGRFEFHLHIPYPNNEDRREILKIYNKQMNLKFKPEALDYAVRRTGDYVDGAPLGTRFSGDHINALCRALARRRLRQAHDEGVDAQTQLPETEPEDIEKALTEWVDRPKMTSAEKKVVATHEAGHAVCSIFCEHSTPIERISIQGDAAGALGFVRYRDRAHRYVVTKGELLDDLCVLMGGREAERLLLDDLSIGSAEDLRRATSIARALVEEFGMGGPEVGVCRYLGETSKDADQRRAQLSAKQLEMLDLRVNELLTQACEKATTLLSENQSVVETLRDMLLEREVIDATTLGEVLKDNNVEVPEKMTISPGTNGKPAAEESGVAPTPYNNGK